MRLCRDFVDHIHAVANRFVACTGSKQFPTLLPRLKNGVAYQLYKLPTSVSQGSRVSYNFVTLILSSALPYTAALRHPFTGPLGILRLSVGANQSRIDLCEWLLKINVLSSFHTLSNGTNCITTPRYKTRRKNRKNYSIVLILSRIIDFYMQLNLYTQVHER